MPQQPPPPQYAKNDPRAMKLTTTVSPNFRVEPPAQGSVQPPAAVLSATPPPPPMPTLSQSTGGFSPDAIRTGIQRWTANNKTPVPILNHVDDLYKAGQQFQAKGLDPYLPIILALRETQGGRDNAKPGSKTGKHNLYNVRGTQGGERKFVDYPDFQTALFGGQNGPDMSTGLVRLLTESPTYQGYRDSKNVGDLLARWSPPVDNNGDIDEQIANYQFMRRYFEGGS